MWIRKKRKEWESGILIEEKWKLIKKTQVIFFNVSNERKKLKIILQSQKRIMSRKKERDNKTKKIQKRKNWKRKWEGNDGK